MVFLAGMSPVVLCKQPRFHSPNTIKSQHTHHDTVARAISDLETVRECLAVTEVDEVVLGGIGKSLSILGTESITTVEERTSLDGVGRQSGAVSGGVVVIVVVVLGRGQSNERRDAEYSL